MIPMFSQDFWMVVILKQVNEHKSVSILPKPNKIRVQTVQFVKIEKVIIDLAVI